MNYSQTILAFVLLLASGCSSLPPEEDSANYRILLVPELGEVRYGTFNEQFHLDLHFTRAPLEVRCVQGIDELGNGLDIYTTQEVKIIQIAPAKYKVQIRFYSGGMRGNHFLLSWKQVEQEWPRERLFIYQRSKLILQEKGD